jgi:hypothetical protein
LSRVVNRTRFQSKHTAVDPIVSVQDKKKKFRQTAQAAATSPRVIGADPIVSSPAAINKTAQTTAQAKKRSTYSTVLQADRH